jgi:PAS domain S-box-containing protein
VWSPPLAILLVAALAGAGVTAYGLQRSRARIGRLLATLREARRDRDFTREVLDRAGFLVVVLDPDGSITTFNRACEELTGYASTDVVGRPFWELMLGPEEAAAVHATFSTLDPAGFPNTFENDWVGPDGRRRRIAWRNTALVDEEGRVAYVVGTGLDVTEQRRAARLFANVLAAATEQAIIGTGPDGIITVFNAGAERMLGYTADEVVGQVTPQILHGLDDRPNPVGTQPDPAVLFGPSEDWSYVRKDGGRVPVALSTSVMRDESGEVVGYLGVARDVSQEQRRAAVMRDAYERERAAAERLR